MDASRISISAKEKLTLISNISTMFSAGIPILEIIDSLLDGAKGNQKKILEKIREDLIQGKRLYASLASFPNVFDKVTINIIKASEEGGTLDIILKDLRDQIKKEIEFSDKLKAAFLYPIVIMLVFLGVLILILLVVIPKIATVFEQLTVDLPLATRMLFALSHIILSYTLLVVLGAILVAILGILLYKSQRHFFQRLFFTLPVVTTLVKQIDLNHFSRSLSLLLSSGITITNALELTQEIVLRRDITKAIEYSKEVVSSGKKLSEAFKEHKDLFPIIMIKITEAGERTGTLEKAMQDISEYFDYEVAKTLKKITILLEPLMLIVVGVLVGGMMLAIIAPIYSLIGQVGA